MIPQNPYFSHAVTALLPVQDCVKLLQLNEGAMDDAIDAWINWLPETVHHEEVLSILELLAGEQKFVIYDKLRTQTRFRNEIPTTVALPYLVHALTPENRDPDINIDSEYVAYSIAEKINPGIRNKLS